MAKLFISFHPEHLETQSKFTITPEWAEQAKKNGVKWAVLPTPDNLSDLDLYNTAKKLAELFLEQVNKMEQ